jgi:hypothetical protein
MKALWALVKRQPVRAQAVVVAAVALFTAFGLGWTGLQVGAVTAFSAAILSFFTETAVTPIEAPALPQGTTVTVLTPAGQPDQVTTV